LIAIPDFGAGAMENWGLITYRETSILYDSTESSSVAHQWVAVVVAHELAHQVSPLIHSYPPGNVEPPEHLMVDEED